MSSETSKEVIFASFAKNFIVKDQLTLITRMTQKKIYQNSIRIRKKY